MNAPPLESANKPEETTRNAPASWTDALWTSGWIVAALLVANTVFPDNSESSEWRVYLILGLATFLGVVVFALGEARLLAALRKAMAIIAVMGALALLALFASTGRLIEAPVLGLLCASPCLVPAMRRHLPLPPVVSAALVFVVSTVSWAAASRLLYWSSPLEYARSSPSLLLPVIAAGVFIAACHPVELTRGWRLPAKPAWLPLALRWTGHGAALFLLTWFSFRTDFFNDLNVLHHWSHWIGPAESVREHGWLLWDIPSQYGFLSILSIAAVPARDAWDALYLLQATLLLVSGLMLYAVVRNGRKGVTNYLFALAVAVGMVCLRPSPETALAGPQAVVSVGPMRFFWCHALLFAVWFFLLRAEPAPRAFRWTGSFLWLAGVLWSVESAAYSTAVFGAGSGVLALQAAATSRQDRAPWTAALRALAPYLLTPVCVLAIALAVIAAYYRTCLGAGPDWRAYADYAVSYGGGLWGMPVEATGPVWLLVIVFCVLSTAGATQLRTAPLHPRLAALFAMWGAIWVTSSYFVSRSHASNVCNLIPIVAMTLVMLPATRDTNITSLTALLSRHAAIPIFAMVLMATLGNTALLGFVQSTQRPFSHIVNRLPLFDKETRDMLDRNGVSADQPLACNYLGAMLPMGRARDKATGDVVMPVRTWLPKPLVLFSGLSPDRTLTYLQRHAERHHEGGWMLAPKVVRGLDARLLPAIEHFYAMRPIDETAYDVLYRCELRTSAGMAETR